MSLELVDRLVQAVLYEGYILYPYRPSAPKNRLRFRWGRDGEALAEEPFQLGPLTGVAS